MKGKKQRRGDGSIWPEAGGYRARDPIGKKRWFPILQAAQKWLGRRRKLVKRKGTDALDPDGKQPLITYGQFWAIYKVGLQLGKPKGTQRIEREAWKRCLGWKPKGRNLPLWETQRIADVTTGIVENYRSLRTDAGYSRATIGQELGLLRYLANRAVELEYCQAPKVRWRVPKAVARRPNLVSEESFEKLKELANARQRALLQWFWDTGARPNELLGVRRADFQTDLRTVRIPTPKTGQRKGAESRVFYLTSEMIAAIEERDRWLKGVVQAGKGSDGTGPKQARAQLDSEWLFSNRHGKKMAKDSYMALLESVYKKAGITGRDFYAYRHTYATRWLASGGDPVTLALLMGTSVDMIAKTYGHLSEEWVRRVQARMRGEAPKDLGEPMGPGYDAASAQPPAA